MSEESKRQAVALSVLLPHNLAVRVFYMVALGTIAFVCIVFAAIAFFRLSAINLTEDAVVMHTAYKDVSYPFRELEFVEVLDRAQWSPGLFRTFGYGYPLPLYGRFYSSRLGHVTIYSVRRTEKLAVFRFHERKLLIQLDPDQIARIRASAPSAKPAAEKTSARAISRDVPLIVP